MLRFKLRKKSTDFRRQLLGGAGGFGDGTAVRPLPLPVKARLEALKEGRQLRERQEGRGGRAEPGNTCLLPRRPRRLAVPRHRDAEHTGRPPREAVDLCPHDVTNAYRPPVREEAPGHRLGENRRGRRGLAAALQVAAFVLCPLLLLLLFVPVGWRSSRRGRRRRSGGDRRGRGGAGRRGGAARA